MKNFTLNRSQLDYRKLLCSLAFILMTAGFAIAQNATNGGSISNDQSVCPGQSPSTITNISPASGGDASRDIQYLWMYGTSASFPGAGWQIAPGINDQTTYNPPAVGSTTFFIRCARRAGFTEFQAESNVVTITALPSPFANINGADNDDVFVGFTYNLSASYSSNTTYEWDFNGDGTPDCFGQNCPFTYNIPGDYNLTLKVTNSYGCSATTSVEIHVAEPSDANIMDPCFCGNPNNILTPTGYYNNDYILINSNPGQTWTYTNTGATTIYNGNLQPLPNGTIIPETQPGVYFLNVWFLQSAGGWTATASNANGSYSLTTGPGPGIICSCSNPLPVDLTSFDAYVEGESVVLKWATATETDNAYFEIEASTDGARFETLVQIEGAGTVATPQQYSYTDENPTNGVNYYRLKQVDTDGEFEYFEVVSVRIEKEGKVFNVTPNPVTTVARVQLTENISEESHIELISSTGQVVKTINVTSNNGVQEVMMGDIAPGIYYIRLVDRLSNNVLNQKIIKQ